MKFSGKLQVNMNSFYGKFSNIAIKMLTLKYVLSILASQFDHLMTLDDDNHLLNRQKCSKFYEPKAK